MSKIKCAEPSRQQGREASGCGDLLPCPFCGRTGLVRVDTYTEEFEGEMVECKCCYASAPSRTWNLRAG